MNLRTSSPSTTRTAKARGESARRLGVSNLLVAALLVSGLAVGCSSGSRGSGSAAPAVTGNPGGGGGTTIPGGVTPPPGGTTPPPGTTPPAGSVDTYVSNFLLDEVVIVDNVTGNPSTRVPVGGKPVDIAMTRGHDFAYVVNAGSQDVSVVDTLTSQVVDTVPVVGSGVPITNVPLIGNLIDPLVQPFVRPTGIGLTPSGDKAVVANLVTISIIDTNQRQVTKSFLPLAFPSLVSILSNPSGAFQAFLNAPFTGIGSARVACTADKAYVTNMITNNVTVIDIPGERVITTIDVGRLPIGIDIDANGTAHVACALDNTVYQIDTATDQLTGSPILLNALLPFEVVADPVPGTVYVSEFGTGEISVIDTSIGIPVGKIPAGPNLAQLLAQAGIPIGGTNPLTSLLNTLLGGSTGTGGLAGLLGGLFGGTGGPGSGTGGTLGSLFGGSGTTSGPQAILGAVLGFLLQQAGINPNNLANFPAIGLMGIDLSKDSSRMVSSSSLMGSVTVTEIQSANTNLQLGVLSPGPVAVETVPN